MVLSFTMDPIFTKDSLISHEETLKFLNRFRKRKITRTDEEKKRHLKVILKEKSLRRTEIDA